MRRVNVTKGFFLATLFAVLFATLYGIRISYAACAGVEVDLASEGSKCIKPGSGESFKDCAQCPEMVVVPAGSFQMGSPKGEEGREGYEGPQHKVTIPEPFAVGKFEVTWEEWEVCVAAGGCKREPDDEGWGRGRRPVINVTWHDARAYAMWLSATTGKSYRLLSEAEWEYAARAGTTGPFSFDQITTDKANYRGYSSYAGSPTGEWRGKTVPTDTFAPNQWGLYQVHGNVTEWVKDCWNDSYVGKPDQLKATGAAWTAGDCDRRILRGGSWWDSPHFLRSADRLGDYPGNGWDFVGFRLARTLNP